MKIPVERPCKAAGSDSGTSDPDLRDDGGPQTDLPSDDIDGMVASEAEGLALLMGLPAPESVVWEGSLPLRPGQTSPGLVRAGTRGHTHHGGFGDLLRDALSDPNAAQALTYAWALMPRAERRGLVDAVIHDGDRQGLEVTPLLDVWRALETDDWVFSGLEAMTLCGEADGMHRMVLVRRGGKAQALEVNWRGDWQAPTDIAVHHHPRWEQDPTLTLDKEGDALDRMAHLMWHHRRQGGCFPERSRAFAGLFDR